MHFVNCVNEGKLDKVCNYTPYNQYKCLAMQNIIIKTCIVVFQKCVCKGRGIFEFFAMGVAYICKNWEGGVTSMS